MRTSKVSAIILKRLNYGESDRILTLFTQEQGKLTAIAKGVRRITSRRAPHLEPLNEVSLTLHRGKNFEVITEAKSSTRRNFGLKSLGFAFYAAEIVDKLLPEAETHPEAYALLRDFLAQLALDEKSTKDFTLRLLWLLGFLPEGQAPKISITDFVEQVAEKRIRSKKLIDEI